jgi:uncharacterized protein YecT (DUF1311 family)
MLRKQIILVVLVFAFFPTFSWAGEDEDLCESTIPAELLECSRRVYELEDKRLNDLYSTFIASVGKENSEEIKRAQIIWIRFKEDYCERDRIYDPPASNYPATFPFVDDKNMCMAKMSFDRSNEIERIIKLKKEEFPDDYFYSFILAPLITRGGDVLPRYFSQLDRAMEEIKEDKEWKNYAQLNCDFSAKYANEDRDTCEARLYFIYLAIYRSLSWPMAFEDPCNSHIPGELLECAQNAHEISDKRLNDIYSTFIASAGKDNSKEIKRAQVVWIRFKEDYCERTYGPIGHPGTIPPVENKNTCLASLSFDRSNEIERIMQLKKGEPADDDFSRWMVLLDAKGQGIKSRFFSNLNSEIAKVEEDKEWKNYVRLTCGFSAKYANDERDTCEARLYFKHLLEYRHIRVSPEEN